MEEGKIFVNGKAFMKYGRSISHTGGDEVKKLNKSVFILIIIMTVLSFTNILNVQWNGETLNLAGLSVIVGVVAFLFPRFGR